MHLAILAAITSLALPASAQDTAPRYAIDLTIIQQGVEVTSARTLIVEGGQAEVILTGADGQHTFTADLQPEQGDGDDDRLVLDLHLNHDGRDLARPTLMLKRGGSAQMRVGTEGPDRALSDGIDIVVSPLPVR